MIETKYKALSGMVFDEDTERREAVLNILEMLARSLYTHFYSPTGCTGGAIEDEEIRIEYKFKTKEWKRKSLSSPRPKKEEVGQK